MTVDPATPCARIELRQVSKTFDTGRSSRLAIDQVSLSVAAGETATLIGPTGCGKTTLLNMVAGFTAPSSGSSPLPSGMA